MAQQRIAYFAVALLLVTPLVAAQTQTAPLLGSLLSVQSTDTTINGQQATYEDTGLKFNPDGTVAAVVNGVSILTVPFVNTNVLARLRAASPVAAGSPLASYTMPLAPRSSNSAVDLQVAATDLPGIISALNSIDTGIQGR